MGVRYDHDFSRVRKTVICHQLMTDTFIDVHEMANPLLFGKGSKLFVVVCLLLRGTWCIMVKKQNDLIWGCNLLPSHLIEGFHRLVIKVIDASQINCAVDNFSSMDSLFTGLSRQQLLYCMHNSYPFLRYVLALFLYREQLQQ